MRKKKRLRLLACALICVSVLATDVCASANESKSELSERVGNALKTAIEQARESETETSALETETETSGAEAQSETLATETETLITEPTETAAQTETEAEETTARAASEEMDAAHTEKGDTDTSVEAAVADEEAPIEETYYEDGSVFRISASLSDAIARLTGVETEEETEEETETETESETETEETDEAQQALEAFLEKVYLGEDFQIPMAMPEEYGTMKGPVTYSYGRLSIGKARRVHPWEQTQTIEDLETLLRTTIAAYDGTWSIYVKNLNTDESFVINDQPMKSASVMKLFIMGTVYTAFEEGELERTSDIMTLMNKMISNSDNSASNQLLYILGDSSYADGIAKVNEFIQSHGYSEMTVEYNGFDNPATNSGDGINQVAAKDVGKLLEDIYRRTWMSRAVSNEMEEMLLAQNTRYKIPAGLPDDVLCANKTGEMSTTQNDAAIIYSDACDYILVVLSNGWSNTNTAISRIASLSTLVYEFFNE
ncbi:MAG: class A beta-lactamase-related serine hydrolase [Lachnospiraceae bacterium]|nr:class A beta-lactamase-related serine hydrolase [Lachnospiraceae bacterium]